MNTQILCAKLNSWFAEHGRALPWRHPDTTPWAVLVSEIMAQQTPVARVIPLWEAWMKRWPTPSDLAAASKADVLTMWANLGYPRRALRLQLAAQGCVEHHNGRVPETVEELEALPGIGAYTARAVAAFAFGQAVPVVDTNVRRVHSRLVKGAFLVGPARSADLVDVADLLPWVDPDPFLIRRHYAAHNADPADRDAANLMCSSLMELGALVCTARSPKCGECPLRSECAWVQAGCPAPSEEEASQAARRVQKFAGTDRQVRGKVMALLRESPNSQVEWAQIAAVWADQAQLERAVRSLVADELVVTVGEEPRGLALPR